MEESAIDVIFELRDLLKTQTERITLLERNMAVMNARLSGELLAKVSAPKAKEVNPPKPKKKPAPTPPPIKSIRNIRVFGHLEDAQGKKLSGVEVHIKDSKDRLIKTTKSNRAGMYMAFLPPGQYTAEFVMPGMQSAFRAFKTMPGQKEVEIT